MRREPTPLRDALAERLQSRPESDGSCLDGLARLLLAVARRRDRAAGPARPPDAARPVAERGSGR